MDGFGQSVDGYFDVADQLSRYLRCRAADHFSDERREKGSIDSRAEFERRRERVRETVVRARQIYYRYDAEENVRLVVADTTHCSVYELGLGVFEWLCDQLGNDEYEPRGDPQTVDRTDLQCTPGGSVRDAYADERTIDDLIREYVAETHLDAGTTPAVDDRGADAQRLRRTLVEKFDLNREDRPLSPWIVDRTDADGVDVRRAWFKTERDPEIVVTGVLASDLASTTGSPAVVLYERGTEELRSGARRSRPSRASVGRSSSSIRAASARCGTAPSRSPGGSTGSTTSTAPSSSSPTTRC